MTPELREKIGGRRVVASVSGGKDSASMSLWLKEQEIEHERVFMDTGWEHPATYEYLRGELTRVIGSVKEIRGPRTMQELIRWKGMFPSRTQRFCTQELKLFPMRSYIAELLNIGIDVLNAVGIRWAESAARAAMKEWEWQDEWDCEIWRPLLRWTEADVIAIHRRHGLRPNPLYLRGASRVGCWPCRFATKEEISLVSRTTPERIEEIRTLEKDSQHEARLRYKRNLAAFAAARRGLSVNQRIAQGWHPPKLSVPTFFSLRDPGVDKHYGAPIDDVVTWANTARGGRQLKLLDTAPPGCMRWGLCETAAPASDNRHDVTSEPKP